MQDFTTVMLPLSKAKEKHLAEFMQKVMATLRMLSNGIIRLAREKSIATRGC
jgi:hypothetical protein